MVNISTYRYQLDKSSKKVRCNACGLKSAVLYVDIEINKYLPDIVQRCDRENKCGHHYTPKQYFQEHPNDKLAFIVKRENKQCQIQKPIEFIDSRFVQQSMKYFETSNFAKFLQQLFGVEISKQLLLKYFVGRSLNDNGKACIFWQIDENYKVRYGKIMCYNSETGKRKKHMPPMAVPVKPVNYMQTFFGCHLLTEHPDKPVAITESEKTAIICSFFMPQYNWIATGGSSGCKWREYQVYKVLKNKEVVLFPEHC